MNINGTLVNYYFHCQRQCWLHANRINLEDNSEDVKIGKAIHETKSMNSNNSELTIDNIKIDKITKDYLIEIKKSDSDFNAVKWQTLYYLKVLKNKGVERKGKIEFIEKGKQDKKVFIIELTDDIEGELIKIEEEIEKLISTISPPEVNFDNKCKKCAYYEYCYI